MAGKLHWKNITVRLGELKAWSQNPKFSTKAQAQRIIDSFKKFDQVQTIAVSPDLEVYDGHQRLSALLTIHGEDYQIDARQSNRHLTTDERKELVITLHSGAVGSYDWQALSGWDAKELQGWGLDSDTLKGWNNDAENLKFMLESKKEDDAQASGEFETSDRFDEVSKKWGTSNNQLWKLGNHFIFCGDSLDIESYKKVLQGGIPVLINADPPYGVNIVSANGFVGGGESDKGMIPFGGRKGNVGGGSSNIAKTGMSYMESNRKKRLGTIGGSKPFGSNAVRGTDGTSNIVEVGKYPVIIGDENTDTAKQSSAILLEIYPDAYHAWWGANYYIEVLEPSPCWLVWNKQTTGHFADCELAWTNADNSAKLFTHRWNGMLRDSEHGRRWHPTQKPAALAEWVIGLFTEKGDVVLDPFGGAGWTLLAAETSERQACIIEKSHEYVAVMLERWSLQTNQAPLLIEDL